MTGRSPLLASEGQRAALSALSGSRDRGEADRARAVLLTLTGWTSARIGEAFGVREDTVRLWRGDFHARRGRQEADLLIVADRVCLAKVHCSPWWKSRPANSRSSRKHSGRIRRRRMV